MIDALIVVAAYHNWGIWGAVNVTLAILAFNLFVVVITKD